MAMNRRDHDQRAEHRHYDGSLTTQGTTPPYQTDDGVDAETSLSLSLHLYLSSPPYTFFSRSPLVSKTLFKVRYSERSIAVWHSCTLSACTWGPVVQWLVQRFRSERLRVRSRRSATFTPSVHVRRQSLPVWPPTLNKILFYKTMRPSWNITDLEA